MTQPWMFDFSGSHLALDFANTVSERASGLDPIERLSSWRELVRFAHQAELIPAREAERLFRWGETQPANAEKIRRDAVALREALHRLFRALARDEHPAPSDVQLLNAWNRQVVLDRDLKWAWADGPDAPGAFMARIVRAAVELAIDPRRDRLRICDSPTCGWIFLDASKNRSRRWCDMKVCGNREKARRFHQRNA